MTKRTILFLLCIIAFAQAWADKLTCSVSAPSEVVCGDQFPLKYTVNSADVDKDNIKIPNLTTIFNVLSGPNYSVQSNFQIINAHSTSSGSTTITFILMANKAGTYTIPGVTIPAEGKTLKSRSVRIKVLPSGNKGSTQGHRQNSGNSSAPGALRTQEAGRRITDKDLFMSVTASKQRVHEQEAILLTYKVYYLVGPPRLIPDRNIDFEGFHTQEVKVPQQIQLEHHNGINYYTSVYQQYVLYPQQTGKLTIPSTKFKATIMLRVRGIDPVDAFFNPGGSVVEVEKTLVTPALTIQVDPLPTPRPANYTNAVGNFSISSSVTPTKLKTNDALNMRIVISGTGNMKLMKTPTVQFPQGFDTYDAKVTDKTRLTTNGVVGDMIYDYLAVPHTAGKYTVPPVEFTFFDTQTGQYKTIKTEPYDIEVEKGAGNSRQAISDFTGKEDLKMLGEDIHYLKLGNSTLHHEGDSFFASLPYTLAYLISFILFAVVLVIFRQKAIDNANEMKMRNKRANKVAVKRLNQAEKLLKAGEQEHFYDEVLKALWGYIGDKLNLPVAELNKDNVQEKLTEKGVDETLTQTFINALNECEFARFAPGDKNAAMDNVYRSASNVIGQMENSMKR